MSASLLVLKAIGPALAQGLLNAFDVKSRLAHAIEPKTIATVTRDLLKSATGQNDLGQVEGIVKQGFIGGEVQLLKNVEVGPEPVALAAAVRFTIHRQHGLEVGVQKLLDAIAAEVGQATLGGNDRTLGGVFRFVVVGNEVHQGGNTGFDIVVGDEARNDG